MTKRSTYTELEREATQELIGDEAQGAAEKFESLLCLIFNRQFEGGTEKCWKLRRAIVDYTKEVQSHG
jgi:hypothetical protein